MYSTNLTEAEIERLAILIEECAEVQQIACKILRHGYESYNPMVDNAVTNKKLLETEVGDLKFSIQFLIENNDINRDETIKAKLNKEQNIQKYLHFNKVS